MPEQATRSMEELRTEAIETFTMLLDEPDLMVRVLSFQHCRTLLWAMGYDAARADQMVQNFRRTKEIPVLA